MKRIKVNVAGSKERLGGPRLLGEIIAQMKNDGVEPFGKGYNAWQAEEQQKGGAK